MGLRVACVQASDGIAVHPCGTLDGVAYVPVIVSDPEPGTLDFTNSGELFAWGFTTVALAWVVGLTIGFIMRVIRSA